MVVIATTPELYAEENGKWFSSREEYLVFCRETLRKLWHLPKNVKRFKFWLEASTTYRPESWRMMLYTSRGEQKIRIVSGMVLTMLTFTGRTCRKRLGKHKNKPFYVRLLYQERDDG